MSDIYFQCDCGKNLAVDEAGIGRTVNCTACNKLIAIPNPAIRFACTKCGNNILAPETMAGKEVQCVNCSAAAPVSSSTKADDSIKFNCPNCRQHLEAPMDMVGVQIACPGCNQNLAVPVKSSDGQTASPPPLHKKAADLPTAIPSPPPLNKTDIKRFEKWLFEIPDTPETSKSNEDQTATPPPLHKKAADFPEAIPRPPPLNKSAIKQCVVDDKGPAGPSTVIANNTKWMIAIVAIVFIAGALAGLYLGKNKKPPSSDTVNDTLDKSRVTEVNKQEQVKAKQEKKQKPEEQEQENQQLVYGTIHEAAAKGDRADVKRHLKKGAALNAKDKDGKTPLIRAAIGGHLNVIQYLVDNGADVNAVDDDNGGALLAATWGAEYYGVNTTGRLDVVKYLVDKGLNVNVTGTGSHRGSTPLQNAASSGYLDVVKFLMDCGAELDTKGTDGWTPLMSAASGGHLDIVKYLVLEKGADVNTKDNKGWTPLTFATYTGHQDVVEFLKQHGAKE